MPLTTEPVKRAYRAREIVRELGVSRATVYNWITAGKLTAYRLGGVTVVDGASYRALLESFEPVTPDERVAS